MSDFPHDIYTEPSGFDLDTLNNLGPLRAMAGIWRGVQGEDVKPKAEGPKSQAYVERLELQPIDPQTNGPQLLYGLRYHTHVVKPNQVKTYHEQVGYWLWEPATAKVIHTIAVPRGVIVMASGTAARDATEFQLTAQEGAEHFGIRSTPFLAHAFRTVEFTIKIVLISENSWSYQEDTVLQIKGKPDLFHHTDQNTLVKIADPTPNPLVR